MRKLKLILLGGLAGVTIGSCGGLASLLDQARFHLDQCNPSDTTTAASCQSAVNAALEALGIDASTLDGQANDDTASTSQETIEAGIAALAAVGDTEIEAAALASSGFLGLAGVDFLQFTEQLTDAQSTDTEDLQEFQDLIDEVETENGEEIDTDQLRLAVAILDGILEGITADDDLRESAFFQLGSTQSLEGFILPLKLVTVTDGEVDASEISDDEAEIIKQNFQNGDDNVSSAGTDDADTLSAMREGDCRCTLADGADYGGPCIRDLMVCNLGDTGDTEQDYDGDGVTAGDRTEDCDGLNNPPGVETCKSGS